MEADYKEKWHKCLEIIRDNVGNERFETWFSCAREISIVDESIVIPLPSHFFYEKYEDDFAGIISMAIKRVFGRKVIVRYSVNMIQNDAQSKVTFESAPKAQNTATKFVRQMEAPVNPLEESRNAGTVNDPQLNPTLTFENYCVGDSNRLPYTIAEFIAKNPNKVEFNPFFLYGEVGVGKTHLIQSIGNHIKNTVPNARVLFIPMRQFQYLLVNAKQKHEIPGFIKWFSDIDVLLIDDLQELAFKDGTMSALFPIFNNLHQKGKKLIFTCDRPPVELDGITDRLIDRFKWGVTERLPKPDYELRKRILEFKARKNGLMLSDDVISLVAEKATGSVRELEGVVMGLLTRSIVHNAEITPMLVNEVLKQSVSQPVKKQINFDMIVETAAEYFNLNPDVIFSKSRVREIADARQMIMYLAKKHTGLSLPAIGMRMNRKHTTVLHDIRCVQSRLEIVPELMDSVVAIEKVLQR